MSIKKDVLIHQSFHFHDDLFTIIISRQLLVNFFSFFFLSAPLLHCDYLFQFGKDPDYMKNSQSAIESCSFYLLRLVCACDNIYCLDSSSSKIFDGIWYRFKKNVLLQPAR